MSAWRSGGIGPEKASAGLRGVAFLAIMIAFLAVSSKYVSGGDDDKPSTPGTSAAARPVVLAPPELRALLPKIAPRAEYRFGEPPANLDAVRDGKADVLVAEAGDAATVAGENRCSDALEIAVKASTTYVACLVVGSGRSMTTGLPFVEAATSLQARAALLEAGFDVPER